MNHSPHEPLRGSRSAWRAAVAASAIASLTLMTPSAYGVDGCKVLLCLAGNWKQIAPCQPEVNQALRDVAKGRGWPSCSMANSSGNNGVPNSNTTPPAAAQAQAAMASLSTDAITATEHQWAWAPGNCPEQYVSVSPSESGPVYECRYRGVINVWVAGSLWSRVWWSDDVGSEGDTATQYSPEARARLGATIDPKFDTDLAVYRAAQEAAAAAEQARSGF